jgi:predicted anti-sigma-YlaC factor YlaD
MKMFQRHVLNDLAAYAEGQLDPHKADRVKTHVAECEECRGALDAVQRAHRMLEALPTVAMPPAEVEKLTAALRRAGERPRHVRPGLVAAAAAVVIAIALAGYFALAGIGPDLIAEPGPAGLTPLASDLHKRLEAGDLAFAFESSDPARVRAWLSSQSAPETSLAAPVDRAGWPPIRPRGAAVVGTRGAAVSVVAYEVDGRPVTLVTAREHDVPDAPEGAWLAKRVYVSRDARGRPSLTWTTGGQTYAIVSSLPGVGQTACLVCHDDQKFRERLDRAVAELKKGTVTFLRFSKKGDCPVFHFQLASND